MRLLYQLDISGDQSDAALEAYWADLPPRLASSRGYAERLVESVRHHGDEIDGLIDAAARNWQLSRLARIDLSILRIAVGEMLMSDGVPLEVVIDEAVELARAYSDQDAPSFVNGVLDRIARDLTASRKAGA